MQYRGFGTQKAEEELEKLFPEARILRMDQDSTAAKDAHEKLLARFARREYDIMVGTQMVAKGLDFEDVTLVGVLGIDSLLFAQGFRAYETVFSLITQVVGRSGRAKDPGFAIIQTTDPDNPVLNLAAAQDYDAFFEQEIAYRKLGLYPPFCGLCVVGFSGLKESEVARAAARFAALLGRQAAKQPELPLRVLGPTPRQYRKDQRKLPLQTHRQVPQRPPLPRPDARNAGPLRAGKAARQSHRRRRSALGRRYLIRTTDLEVPTMAIRNIVKEGDPILNKVCRPVTNFDDRLATLLDDMRETMIDADGVGLAGPQVGMLRRLFVVWDTTDAPEEIPADYEYKFIDFVNPEILAVSEDEETAYEGCLSFPGHNGAVTRPAAVKVRAQDRNGNWFELEAEGLLARCIQHENDHLDGITIMQSSEYFYEDTEEGKKAAREAKGNK